MKRLSSYFIDWMTPNPDASFLEYIFTIRTLITVIILYFLFRFMVYAYGHLGAKLMSQWITAERRKKK